MTGCSGRTAADSTTANETVQTATNAPTADVPAFSADSAYRNIERQVAMGFRTPGSEGHARCGQFILSELARYGADTVIQQKATVTTHRGKQITATNILGRFNTSAPRRILIAAHYDTRPWADEDSDKTNHTSPIAGANDGGSGVGVALELARLVGAQSPQIGVDFLFTDAEDSGAHDDSAETQNTWCLGSQYWAEYNPYTPADRPVFGIVLDMVGGKDALFYREYFSEHIAPVINRKIWETASQLGIDRFINEARGAVTDDHIYITAAGIPCIDIIECANPATGSFPPYWHTTSDNMDIISHDTLLDVGRVITHVIYTEKP